MDVSFWGFLTDPILRGPTLGTIFMAVSAAIVGVLAHIKSRSLLGESLSHAAYPGVIIASAIGAQAFPHSEFGGAALGLLGALLSALLGLVVIEWLTQRFSIPQDSALCLVLSGAFAVGLTLASRLQFTDPIAYKRTEIYLYGQAATMGDLHIVLYGVLSLVIAVAVFVIYREIQISSFDRAFAKSVGVKIHLIDAVTYLLIALAVVIGLRSVGVILMSAMLIAPPLAARQFTHRLSVLFLLAGLFAGVSALLGNIFSVLGSEALASGQHRSPLPTGPMIVLVAALLCLSALLFAPRRGLVLRAVRISLFRYRSLQENILKAIWKEGGHISLDGVGRAQSVSKIYLRFLISRMVGMGWVVRGKGGLKLTPDGVRRAARVVRRHRLWELYLVKTLGLCPDHVHPSAELAEHVISKELEESLTLMLDDPEEDPHQQPIPPRNATQ